MQHELPYLEYTWYRNGEILLRTSDNLTNSTGFKLTPSGTLKILYSNMTSGIYRCLANETKCNIGAVLSKHVVVKVASMYLMVMENIFQKKIKF